VDGSSAVQGLGLAEAIGVLRDELLRARAQGAGSLVQLPIESMTVELTVTASRSLTARPVSRSPSLRWSWGLARRVSAGPSST
jgi:hypothetical protein